MQFLPLLLQYFDKLFLALAASWLTVTTLGHIPEPPIMATVPELEAQIVKIDEYMKTKQPRPVTPPQGETRLKHALRAPDATNNYPAWLAHRRPGFVFEIPPPPDLPDVWHFPPTKLTLDRSIPGQLSLAWMPAEGNQHVTWELQIQRQETGANWQTLVTLPAGERSYVDASLRARVDYSYRVVSLAKPEEDPNFDSLDLRDFKPIQASPPAGPLQVAPLSVITTLQIYEVTRAMLIANPKLSPTEEWARVRVSRYLAGGFVGKAFLVHIGEPIGKTSKSGDFSTGAVLLDVWSERKDRRTQQFIRIRHSDGLVETIAN